MKRLLILIEILMMSALVAFGAEKPSSASGPALRAELLAAREAAWMAWFHNDQDALKRLLPPDLIAINNGEQEWQGLQQTLQGAQQFAARGDKLISLKFDRTEIQIYSEVAVLYSLFTLETEEGGKRTRSSGRATEIFRRKGNTWVNTGWHLDSGA
jgi:ketosteroid isomerase-like protein